MWRLLSAFAVLCLVLAGSLLVASSGWVFNGDRPAWHGASEQKFVGKTVIIGLTFLDAAGVLDHREQLHGRIRSADSRKGFEVALEGKRAGETYWLPPDSTAFERARPGVYRLKGTGEDVIDPDFIGAWTVTKPTR